MASSEHEPAAELADLAHALGAQLARAARRGVRRTAGALPAANAPATPEPKAEVRRPRERPVREVAVGAADTGLPAGARGDTRGDARGDIGAGTRIDPGGTERTAGTAAADAAPARSAADVARQAAACRTLDELRAAVSRCEACTLHATRKQTVFADGDGSSGAMFIGEAPGADEDDQGVPFVGRAGKLLTDIIVKGMGLARERTAIANVLKCRPPENRDPTQDEKRTCTPWLDRQVDLLDPKVLIPLGRHAAMHVLEVDTSMGRMRGAVHERRGRKVVATYHPAYLLRSPSQKKECWKDIQLAMVQLGLPARGGQG